MNPIKKKDGSVQTEQTAKKATETKWLPINVFRVDDVSASVFAREAMFRGEDRTFYSVSFSRSYRNSAGERKYVKTFNMEDLPKVVTVAQQASEYIHGRQVEESK